MPPIDPRRPSKPSRRLWPPFSRASKSRTFWALNVRVELLADGALGVCGPWLIDTRSRSDAVMPRSHDVEIADDARRRSSVSSVTPGWTHASAQVPRFRRIQAHPLPPTHPTHPTALPPWSRLSPSRRPPLPRCVRQRWSEPVYCACIRGRCLDAPIETSGRLARAGVDPARGRALSQGDRHAFCRPDECSTAAARCPYQIVSNAPGPRVIYVEATTHPLTITHIDPGQCNPPTQIQPNRTQSNSIRPTTPFNKMQAKAAKKATPKKATPKKVSVCPG